MPLIYISLTLLLSSCINNTETTKQNIKYFLNINEKQYYKNIEKELFSKEIQKEQRQNIPSYKVIYYDKIFKKAIFYDKYNKPKNKYIFEYTEKQKLNTIYIINNKKELITKRLFQDNLLIKEVLLYPQNKNKNLTTKQTKVFIKVNNPYSKTILRYTEKYKNDNDKEVTYYRYFVNTNKLKQVVDKIEIWENKNLIRKKSHTYNTKAQKIETTIHKQDKIDEKIFYNKYGKIKEKWDYINKSTIYYDRKGDILRIKPLRIKKEDYYETHN